MRHRPLAPNTTIIGRSNRTHRGSTPVIAARLRREQARHLAWFNI